MSSEIPTVSARTIRVLFVDRDLQVFREMMEGLRQLNQPMQLEQCHSAAEAMDFLGRAVVDVVICGPKVPGLQDSSLLREVRNRYPGVIRYVLASDNKADALSGAANLAHQSVVATCTGEELHHLMLTALEQVSQIREERVSRVLSRLEGLPNRSAMMTDFLHLLSGQTPSVEHICGTVAKHPGMVARLLKIANSPIFGQTGRIQSLDDAIGLLGLDMVASLFFSMQVLTMETPPKASRLEVEVLWAHCVQVSVLVRRIGLQMKAPSASTREAVTAALLHDLGKVVMANAMPVEFAAAQTRSVSERIPLWQAEQPILGNTHAEVGACLLRLWGFPRTLVEAVAHHHAPHRASAEASKSVLMVHLADAVVHAIDGKGTPTFVDVDCLRAQSLPTELAYWIDIGPSAL
jgi:putative nucleotidyltransferase with HDIG domain